MKIRNTKIIFLIEPHRNIRHEIFKYEAKLKDSFKVPFINNNIPDEAQPNIVRFFSTSLNYHSNIQVAQDKIILETTYDNGFEDDFRLGYEYLKNKISILKYLIEKEKFKYFGIVSIIDFEMDIAKVLPLIKDITNFNIIDNNIMELKYFYSKIYKENYYANISISNYIRFEGKLPESQKQNGTFEMKKESQGIQVIIDFNNKAEISHNNININTFESVLNSFSQLIQKNDINNYIKGELL